ncbi:hypothetical protein INT45_009820 [Circinella minor]|uniref:Alcohol dehydrogenase-like N-terminal domain-containing protein n=1 Tax=Circinella minor TaxID=1195481 RepID=A0A8H7S3S1_9FUNG|nr:hypothetical protein INT45_009820 [Circinella minor]
MILFMDGFVPEKSPTEYPFVEGYEIVDTITKIGRYITQFNIGDHVGIGNHCDSCHQCKECKNNQENVCRQGPRRKMTGYGFNGDKIYGGFGNKWRDKTTFAPLKKHGVKKRIGGADEFILTSNNTGGSNSYLLLSQMILCTSFGIHEFNWSYYLSWMEPDGIFILTAASEWNSCLFDTTTTNINGRNSCWIT